MLVLDDQHVDDQYDSDASCEFGDPDPYDQFVPCEVSLGLGEPLLEPMDDGGARPPLADTGPTPSTEVNPGATN